MPTPRTVTEPLMSIVFNYLIICIGILLCDTRNKVYSFNKTDNEI